MILAKIISVVISSCAALLAEASSLAQESRRIHYGTTTSSAHLPVWVAKDAGFFSKSSLNVGARADPRRFFDYDGDHERPVAVLRCGRGIRVAARIEGGDVV